MISYWSWGNAWTRSVSIARRSTSRLLRVMMMTLISMRILPDRPHLRTRSRRPGFRGGSRGGWARCRGVHHLLGVLQRREHLLVVGLPDQFRLNTRLRPGYSRREGGHGASVHRLGS